MKRVIFCIEEEFTLFDERITTVLAVFPQERFDNYGNISCYSHQGGHNGCSRSYFEALEVCEYPEQYLQLKKELLSIGYELNVINEQKASKGIKRFAQ